MWERRTFHECADELLDASASFKAAHANRLGWDEKRRSDVLADSSRRGREILQILALSIRVEQDIGLTEKSSASVGVIRTDVTAEEQRHLVSSYRPPYQHLDAFEPLGLRDGLNKIAHHDPLASSFYVDDTYHELVLAGTDQKKKKWVAILSLKDLAQTVTGLPDRKVSDSPRTT